MSSLLIGSTSVYLLDISDLLKSFETEMLDVH